ncbi:hypothetical protein GW17_00060437 [Ensete ventricosum]|nr:hypothetical protein GW17_00060437 [Ensete ventricosum]
MISSSPHAMTTVINASSQPYFLATWSSTIHIAPECHHHCLPTVDNSDFFTIDRGDPKTTAVISPPVKDADLEQMPTNLKEGDRYVVNHDEGLTAIDFDGHVSLVEKESASMAERRFGTGHAQKDGA